MGFPEYALEIAQQRVTEALETEADTLVSTCPHCKSNLRAAIEIVNPPLRILDLPEIVEKTFK